MSKSNDERAILDSYEKALQEMTVLIDKRRDTSICKHLDGETSFDMCKFVAQVINKLEPCSDLKLSKLSKALAHLMRGDLPKFHDMIGDAILDDQYTNFMKCYERDGPDYRLEICGGIGYHAVMDILVHYDEDQLTTAIQSLCGPAQTLSLRFDAVFYLSRLANITSSVNKSVKHAKVRKIMVTFLDKIGVWIRTTCPSQHYENISFNRNPAMGLNTNPI